MLIKTEEIANKNLFNFYLPQSIFAPNAAILALKGTEFASPFLQNLNSIPGVEYYLFAGDLLAVKYASSVDSSDVKALVLAELDDYFANPEKVEATNFADDKSIAEALADSLIRPTLNRDNGDITIHSFTNGELELEFTGHCAGCPYAQNTLNKVVSATLKRFMPQLQTIKLRK